MRVKLFVGRCIAQIKRLIDWLRWRNEKKALKIIEAITKLCSILMSSFSFINVYTHVSCGGLISCWVTVQPNRSSPLRFIICTMFRYCVSYSLRSVTIPYECWLSFTQTYRGQTRDFCWVKCVFTIMIWTSCVYPTVNNNHSNNKRRKDMIVAHWV